MAAKIDPAGDWKEQARREKEKLSEELDSSVPEGEGADAYSLPEADFLTFVSGLATQTMIALGQTPDPFSGETAVRLDVARYHIDLLGILAEKTKGNLSGEEDRVLKSVLSELRMGYVAVSSGGAAASAPAPGPAKPDAPPPEADKAGGSRIILPT